MTAALSIMYVAPMTKHIITPGFTMFDNNHSCKGHHALNILFMQCGDEESCTFYVDSVN